MNPDAGTPGRATRWHHQARRRLRHSIMARLVALFVVLAVAMTGTFLAGMQRALSVGWRDAARPLLTDYVDRLVAEIGSPPSLQRARSLADRLPLRIRISGPQLNWQTAGDDEDDQRYWARRDGWQQVHEGGLLVRETADGHRIELGLDARAWRARPRLVGWATLAVLLLLTALAYAYVRRLLRPLDDIRAGAQRFGAGRFDQPIAPQRHDELGDLARDVNAMAASIHGMLEAKRGLLLAISHELRSPITRARLNTELLGEAGDTGARRAALLRDLQEMADLVSGLLEGERLGQGHAALHREPTDFAALAREVVAGLGAGSRPGAPIHVDGPARLPPVPLDRARMRLLLRNLLENALRHGPAEGPPPELRYAWTPGELVLTVRDHGPGAREEDLPRLSEPFFRADEARARDTGGVGLGLYLCRLVAQAHGGTLQLRNAAPGLEAEVRFPLAP
jgi:signal transduction histidine kinase